MSAVKRALRLSNVTLKVELSQLERRSQPGSLAQRSGSVCQWRESAEKRTDAKGPEARRGFIITQDSKLTQQILDFHTCFSIFSVLRLLSW